VRVGRRRPLSGVSHEAIGTAVGASLSRRERRRDAETHERAAGEPALPAQEAPVAADEIAGGARRERVHRVAHDAEPHEGQAEHENLRLQRSTRRIEELRQEREKEDRRLRVEEIDHETVAEDAAQRFGRRRRRFRAGDPWP